MKYIEYQVNYITSDQLRSIRTIGEVYRSSGELYYIWIILDHIGSYWIILDYTGSYWIILDHIGLYWIILDHIGSYWIILDHIGSY